VPNFKHDTIKSEKPDIAHLSDIIEDTLVEKQISHPPFPTQFFFELAQLLYLRAANPTSSYQSPAEFLPLINSVSCLERIF
jgi:hypothetical protein